MGPLTGGYFWGGGLFLLFLLIVFIGMGITVLKVIQGTVPPEVSRSDYRDRLSTVLPIVGFMALVLLLGLYIPPFLSDMLQEALKFLGNPL